jgi:hypothetical protein
MSREVHGGFDGTTVGRIGVQEWGPEALESSELAGRRPGSLDRGEA